MFIIFSIFSSSSTLLPQISQEYDVIGFTTISKRVEYVLIFLSFDVAIILRIANHALFALSISFCIPWVKVPGAEIVKPKDVYFVTLSSRVLERYKCTDFFFFHIYFEFPFYAVILQIVNASLQSFFCF